MRYSVVAGVVVEKAVYRFDRPFDYSVPIELVDKCKPGCRVTVPFGRGNTKRQGLVLYVNNGVEINGNDIKNIYSVIDNTPLLSTELLGLVKWLKENTFCTYYDAVRTLLPFGLNLKIVSYLTLRPDASPQMLAALSAEGDRVVAFLRKKGGTAEQTAVIRALKLDEGDTTIKELLQCGILSIEREAKQNMRDPTVTMAELCRDADIKKELTPKQRAVVELLEEVSSAGVKEIAYYAGVTTAVINALEKKGVIRLFPMPTMLLRQPTTNLDRSEIVLTEDQQRAYKGLFEKMESDRGETALLYGVTGSGKTSVFLKLAQTAVDAGKGVIIMVPEISLTPQTLARFRGRFGDKVAVFHSAMSLGQRMEEWKRVASGSAMVAIGTRSAVFAPMKNIGLIVMDEEQEHTYKSEQAPRFHARDVARVRNKYHKGLLLLASATPSVESSCLAKNNIYGLYRLDNRYGNATLPRVVTVDMRKELSEGNTGVVSRTLAQALTNTLNNGKQAILLLNRRGHNTYVSCPACGYVFNCENCSISLTYHSANKKLMCHYCGASHSLPEKCPQCNNNGLRFSGIGTQRAFEDISALFPNARILRLDADTTMTRDAFEKGLTAFSNGEYDIMLGTQMVAKGLDFPGVTLVGVLSADQSLYSDDFRAFERTFSLLTQVIGRSGRGEEKGIAVLQTNEPDNEIIELACKQDYDGFYETEIATRRLMIYPPYCDIVMLGVAANTPQLAQLAATRLFEIIKKALKKQKYSEVKMIILGPTVANIPRVNQKYRQRLILKTKNTPVFRELLQDVLIEFYTVSDKTASVFVDINPESII